MTSPIAAISAEPQQSSQTVRILVTICSTCCPLGGAADHSKLGLPDSIAVSFQQQYAPSVDSNNTQPKVILGYKGGKKYSCPDEEHNIRQRLVLAISQVSLPVAWNAKYPAECLYYCLHAMYQTALHQITK